MSTMTPEKLADRLDENDDELLLLDIRPPDAFEAWHIPGSRNVDVYEALQSEPESAAETLASLPEEPEIVTVCGAGKVSATATAVLDDLGYNATTLVDGMAGWARVHRRAELPVAEATLLQVARPGTGCLSYVLISSGGAIIVDPSQYTTRYEEVLETYDASLEGVLETHAHADHVSGARELATTYDVPHYLHPADAPTDAGVRPLVDGRELSLGETEIEVIHTPGHTAGSVTFEVGSAALLTGDTLFLGSVGRPDLGDDEVGAIRERAATLYESLQRLLDRPDDTLVLPAHEPGAPRPPTASSLGEVRDRNGLVGLEYGDFVEAITGDVPEPPANHDRIKRANLGRTTLEADEARHIELGPNQCAAN